MNATKQVSESFPSEPEQAPSPVHGARRTHQVTRDGEIAKPIEPLFTVADVAARFQISEWGVYRLINHPKHPLPASRIAGKWRFDPQEVEAWRKQFRFR